MEDSTSQMYSAPKKIPGPETGRRIGRGPQKALSSFLAMDKNLFLFSIAALKS